MFKQKYGGSFVDVQVVTGTFERLKKIEDEYGIGGNQEVTLLPDGEFLFTYVELLFVLFAHATAAIVEAVVAEVQRFSVSRDSRFDNVIVAE